MNRESIKVPRCGMSFMDIQNSSEKSSRALSEKIFSLESENDLIRIRKFGRELAENSGFKSVDQTVIATAISEICRNVLQYAGSGQVKIEKRKNDKPCIAITVKDTGPGIENVQEALKEGFSSKEGLGIGLSGTKQLMDKFEIQTAIGKGTTVEMCKYLEEEE